MICVKPKPTCAEVSLFNSKINSHLTNAPNPDKHHYHVSVYPDPLQNLIRTTYLESLLNVY